jgi:hypothetical protein
VTIKGETGDNAPLQEIHLSFASFLALETGCYCVAKVSNDSASTSSSSSSSSSTSSSSSSSSSSYSSLSSQTSSSSVYLYALVVPVASLEEGHALVPNWMMQVLHCSDGGSLNVERGIFSPNNAQLLE